VVAAWTAAALEGWGRKLGKPLTCEDVETTTWAIAELARELSAAAYLHTLQVLSLHTRRMAMWWENGFDLLVTPTLGGPPPRLGDLAASADDPLELLAKTFPLIPFTPPFNITGQPAMSLPLHWNAAGLPIGVQLVAAYGREDLLLRVGAQLERELPWANRRPLVHA